MAFEETSTRLWKRLSRQERAKAAECFWEAPPAELTATALGAIAKARRLRPQVARALSQQQRSEALGSLLEPGETIAAALLVSLHLKERRPLLGTFLSAVGLPHEDGLLKEEQEPAAPLSDEAASAGVQALLAAYDRSEVETYLNTLWLQDPERWAALPKSLTR